MANSSLSRTLKPPKAPKAAKAKFILRSGYILKKPEVATVPKISEAKRFWLETKEFKMGLSLAESTWAKVAEVAHKAESGIVATAKPYFRLCIEDFELIEFLEYTVLKLLLRTLIIIY